MPRTFLVGYDLLEAADQPESLHRIYADFLFAELRRYPGLTAHVIPETLDYLLSRAGDSRAGLLVQLAQVLHLPPNYLYRESNLIWGELEALELQYANAQQLTLVCFNSHSYQQANHPENASNILTLSQFLNQWAIDRQLQQILQNADRDLASQLNPQTQPDPQTQPESLAACPEDQAAPSGSPQRNVSPQHSPESGSTALGLCRLTQPIFRSSLQPAVEAAYLLALMLSQFLLKNAGQRRDQPMLSLPELPLPELSLPELPLPELPTDILLVPPKPTQPRARQLLVLPSSDGSASQLPPIDQRVLAVSFPVKLGVQPSQPVQAALNDRPIESGFRLSLQIGQPQAILPLQSAERTVSSPPEELAALAPTLAPELAEPVQFVPTLPGALVNRRPPNQLLPELLPELLPKLLPKPQSKSRPKSRQSAAPAADPVADPQLGFSPAPAPMRLDGANLPPDAVFIPRTLFLPPGQNQLRLESGDYVIYDFDGVGRGVMPALEVINQVDLLQFADSRYTADNLLLEQEGSDLVIKFEGDPSLSVRLKDFSLEQLDNLSVETWASATVGNLQFGNSSTLTQDDFDVINSDQQLEQVVRPNTVTFLNELANRTAGQEGSNDVINGLAGDDYLLGLSGSDQLRGGAGDDWLWGGADDDILSGGVGFNQLNGGSGRDQFMLSSAGTVIIQDFVMGEDWLSFEDIALPAQVSAQVVNRNTLLFDQADLLAVLTGLQSSSLTPLLQPPG